MQNSTTPRASARGPFTRTAATVFGLGLTLGLFAGPVSAAERPTADAVPADAVQAEVKPTEVRPQDRPGDGENDVEVLLLSCGRTDRSIDDARAHVGCEWRASTSRHAAGYQLWRIVDRGDRELVARFGLDIVGARDVLPAGAEVVRYAVLAVNENGRVVGQSRVQRIELGGGGDVGRDVEAMPARVRAAWPLAVR